MGVPVKHGRAPLLRVPCAGMKWMQYFVSVALLCGTVTGLTVGLFSASRIIMAAARGG